MKLLRIGDAGRERPCVMDAEGRARDVSALVTDFNATTIPHLAETLAGADLSALPEIATEGRRIGAPMARPGAIYGIGLNYSDHAAEAGMALPEEPILFTKAPGAFSGPNDPIRYSPQMKKLDWEVELGVVIGRPALNVSEADAPGHILGYTLVNDISERAWQLERGGQWAKGKSFPGFCPTGPWIVTTDELGDPGAVDLWLEVNGERMQTGTTARMVFGAARIVSHLSTFLRLEPGDLICTGTPPGVGMGRRPQRWLNIGDRVTLGASGLGTQAQEVVPL
ncbi:MAG: 2-hydroxyhepta-2,4-diene-1,7-dioate isomerase [Rhodobacterales bacterium]|nr:MAG: 2-hydroxyhepta-2,4-diene-1,7-dioate isomerase [Rhodobacterales bacterium]